MSALSMRKPGEPIYLRRHMIALALAVILPIVVFDLLREGNIARAVRGEKIGTLVGASTGGSAGGS